MSLFPMANDFRVDECGAGGPVKVQEEVSPLEATRQCNSVTCCNGEATGDWNPRLPKRWISRSTWSTRCSPMVRLWTRLWSLVPDGGGHNMQSSWSSKRHFISLQGGEGHRMWRWWGTMERVGACPRAVSCIRPNCDGRFWSHLRWYTKSASNYRRRQWCEFYPKDPSQDL